MRTPGDHGRSLFATTVSVAGGRPQGQRTQVAGGDRAIRVAWLIPLPFVLLAVFAVQSSHAGVQADFDGDGRGDLAIGVPNESLGSGPEGKFQAGAVHILYGARHRLGLVGDRYLTEDTPGIEGGGASDFARFGAEFAAGDFDGDGHDDLAIGAPLKDLGSAYEAGAVHILYGSRRGLTPRGDKYVTENSPGVKGGVARSGDAFGGALAAGDFSRDGRDDLAIGAPNVNVTPDLRPDGAVHILYGGRRQRTVWPDQYLTTENLGFRTADTEGGRFGASLAAGDLNGDRRLDLAATVEASGQLPVAGPVDSSGVAVHLNRGRF
jgi:hypothetical protein